MRRLPLHLALAALLSLAASWLLWKDLFKPIPAVPVAPAAPALPPPRMQRIPSPADDSGPLPSPLILEGPFNEVINQLRAAANLNIWVNYRAMAAGGIPKDTPICLDVSGQSLDAALDSLLRQASTPQTTLICKIEGRFVDIKLPTPPFVSDFTILILDVRPFLGRLPSPREKAEAQALMNQIKTTIDPKSWQNKGGDGDIHYMGGQLVVLQNKQNQRAITSLIDRLYLRQQLRVFTSRAAALVVSSLLLVGLVHLLVNLYQRKSHRSSSLCPHCGYDLRASPDLCPECGQSKSPTLAPSHTPAAR